KDKEISLAEFEKISGLDGHDNALSALKFMTNIFSYVQNPTYRICARTDITFGQLVRCADGIIRAELDKIPAISGEECLKRGNRRRAQTDLAKFINAGTRQYVERI